MKNSEEAIEKVLAGLRDSEAPKGMERRILKVLEDKAAARDEAGWRWVRPIWMMTPVRPVVTRSLVYGVALVGLFAVGLAIPALRRLGRSPARVAMESRSAGSVPLAASASAESAPLPAIRVGVRKVRARGAARVVDSGESVAVSEMRAASRPAPPMPLTEQERLLLRIVHKDDPVEMAVLNPVLRAAQDAEDQAEFQRFFGATAAQAATESPKIEQPKSEQPTTEPTTTEPSTTGDNK